MVQAEKRAIGLLGNTTNHWFMRYAIPLAASRYTKGISISMPTEPPSAIRIHARDIVPSKKRARSRWRSFTKKLYIPRTTITLVNISRIGMRPTCVNGFALLMIKRLSGILSKFLGKLIMLVNGRVVRPKYAWSKCGF